MILRGPGNSFVDCCRIIKCLIKLLSHRRDLWFRYLNIIANFDLRVGPACQGCSADSRVIKAMLENKTCNWKLVAHCLQIVLCFSSVTG